MKMGCSDSLYDARSKCTNHAITRFNNVKNKKTNIKEHHMNHIRQEIGAN